MALSEIDYGGAVENLEKRARRNADANVGVFNNVL